MPRRNALRCSVSGAQCRIMLQFLLLFIACDSSQSENQPTDDQLQLQFALCPGPLFAPPADTLSGTSVRPAMARSLGFLPHAGARARVDLMRQNASRGTVPFPDVPLRCAIRLEACEECVLRVQWVPPRGHISDLQMQSLSYCDSSDMPDSGTQLQLSEELRACFALYFSEERAERVLQTDTPDALLADPALVYRRVSLWDADAAEGTFNSTGNTLWLIAIARNMRDAQVTRYVAERLFPLRVSVQDASEIIRIRPVAPSASSAPIDGDADDPDPEWAEPPASGLLYSPRFLAAYPRALRRNWTLQAPSASARVWLAFDDFHLHYLSELKILDSDGRTELFNSRQEHNRRPTKLVSEGPSVTVLFASDEFTELFGFSARYGVTTAESGAPPPPRNCDAVLDASGGRLTLADALTRSGTRRPHLTPHERVDCIWLIIGRAPASELYARVTEFHVPGTRLELRDGGTSADNLLLTLDGEQTGKQLAQKQPEQGVTATGDPPAFYLRLRGRVDSLTGLSVVYAQFHRGACGGARADTEFRCDNGRCIRAELRCDGQDHCGDSSDELRCGPREGDDDPSAMPSGMLTVAFGVLSVFLLVLLLVLLASRTARRHLALAGRQRQHSLHRATRPRAPTQSRHHRRAATVQQCCGLAPPPQQPQNANGAARRNSSALATQLDFAMLNNLLQSGAAGANLLAGAPAVHALGERRFFVTAASDAQPASISVIEAPPSYADALKHPKVTPRGSRHLVHPAPAPAVLRLSPAELLRTEGPSGTLPDPDDREDSPGLLSRSTSPFQSARTLPEADDADADSEKSTSSGESGQRSQRCVQSAREIAEGRDAEHAGRLPEVFPEGGTSSAPGSARLRRPQSSRRRRRPIPPQQRRARRSTVAGDEGTVPEIRYQMPSEEEDEEEERRTPR